MSQNPEYESADNRKSGTEHEQVYGVRKRHCGVSPCNAKATPMVALRCKDSIQTLK
jgi:hypothetical protein